MPRIKPNVYTIYSYTAPDGRKYIGKTGLARKARSGKDGVGYKTSGRFWDAILNFGWKNFKYDVLASVNKDEIAAEEKAFLLETHYIRKYRTTDIRFGFNKYQKDVPRNPEKQSASRLNYRVIHKDGVYKQVPGSQFESYISDGWAPGWLT